MLAVVSDDARAPGSSMPFSSTCVSGISSTLGRAVDACAFCGAPSVLTATDATASAAKGVLILMVQAFSRKSGSEANAEAAAGNDTPTFQNCYIYLRRVELRIRKYVNYKDVVPRVDRQHAEQKIVTLLRRLLRLLRHPCYLWAVRGCLYPLRSTTLLPAPRTLACQLSHPLGSS